MEYVEGSVFHTLNQYTAEQTNFFFLLQCGYGNRTHSKNDGEKAYIQMMELKFLLFTQNNGEFLLFDFFLLIISDILTVWAGRHTLTFSTRPLKLKTAYFDNNNNDTTFFMGIGNLH